MIRSMAEESVKWKLDEVVRIVFSVPKGSPVAKATVRPVLLQDQKMWQVERLINSQAFHENVGEGSLLRLMQDELFGIFKQVTLITNDTIQEYRLSKKGKIYKKVSPYMHKSQADASLAHDKAKAYLLEEGAVIPPLVDLGVFDENFCIVKSKFDKYKQINRFVEIIHDECKGFAGEEITVIDFGCGKSYLTFIVYHYLASIMGLKATVYGYDLKKDVVAACNAIAEKHNYSGLHFYEGDMKCMHIDGIRADIMIALHACDTLTDYALHYAICNHVEYIFSVPCCQHEINSQIHSEEPFSLLQEHGLIKERFSSLLTDSIRCEVLKNYGYTVDVIEFVDFSHSPKNLMIRAKKRGEAVKSNTGRLEQAMQAFGLTPKLVALLNSSDGIMQDMHVTESVGK